MNARDPTGIVIDPATARRRVALVAACLAVAILAQWLVARSPSAGIDPDVATLLHGMALVKGMLVAAAIGAVWWRFGWPTTARAAWSYGLGLATMVGATMLIAHLTWIVGAAVAFHGGALAVMIAAWRDDGLLRGSTRVAVTRDAAARTPVVREKSQRRPSSAPGIAPHAI